MTRPLLLIIVLLFCASTAQAQSFTTDDLVSIASMPVKSIDNYLSKKGFLPAGKAQMRNGITTMTFYQKRKGNSPDSVSRRIDLFKELDTYCFAFYTTSQKEFMEGCRSLVKAGFISAKTPDSTGLSASDFQKKNITVKSGSAVEEDERTYSFVLRKKELPTVSGVQYAEDLLKFNSHELLASFFGEKNVIKDQYYFAENELKKCSVLFPNSNQQALFVWNDETNYSNLSYVLISGILPTAGAVQFSGYVRQNKWTTREGLYSGMSLLELATLNDSAFTFFGRDSEFAFMIDPSSRGNINFKKTGIMLGCVDCSANALLDKDIISSKEALDYNLHIIVSYLMISKDSKASRETEPVSR